MKKKVIVLLGLFSSLLLAFNDSDLDGVEDSVDKCPNTPFMDLVDQNGCTKKSLISQHHYDIIVGGSYSAADFNSLTRSDTYATSLQVDYYYKDFSLTASTSYYKTDSSTYSQSGFYDTFVGASYRLKPSKDLRLYLGAGVLLPTYKTSLNNNNTDYKASVSATYSIKNFNIFGGYSYTLIGDDDIAGTSYQYQNTSSYNVGVGYYFTTKLYMSTSYYRGNSIYKTSQDIKSASLYAYYSIDANYFFTANYSRGLSDTATDNYLSLKLGYYF